MKARSLVPRHPESRVVRFALFLGALAAASLSGSRAMGEELCAPAGLQCRVVNGHVQITVIPDPRCPCENFVVMRDNRVGIPLLRPPAFFQDPEPCEGRHTYVAACRSKEGTSGVDPTPDALGCESYTCR